MRFKRAGVLVADAVFDNLPHFKQSQRSGLKGLPFEVEFLGMSSDADESLARLDSLDAVLIYPMLMSAAEEKKLLAGLLELKIPSFSALGRRDVEAGMLATLRRALPSVSD